MKSSARRAFRTANRLAARARPILSSRYSLLLVVVLSVGLHVPSLFSGYLADDNWHRREFSPSAMEKLGIPVDVLRNGSADLYAFSGRSPQRSSYLRDKGIQPWWLSDGLKIRFWRPIASLSLALDYLLWVNDAILAHGQSILWFLVLIVLVARLYRLRLSSSASVGLALLLLSIDDVHSGPVGWISNRHALISMIFGVLCLVLYVRGVQESDRRRITFSYGAFVAALLASEMGIAAAAYLFSHALFVDRGAWRAKAKRLLPFGLIVIIWRVVYVALGHGVSGSLLYVDPVSNPLDFLTALVRRFPMLLLSSFSLPVADLFLMLSAQGATIAAVLATLVIALAVSVAYPLLRRNRGNGFWRVGLHGRRDHLQDMANRTQTPCAHRVARGELQRSIERDFRLTRRCHHGYANQ